MKIELYHTCMSLTYPPQLLYLNNYSIYVASALLGLGGPIIWTAQVTKPLTMTKIIWTAQGTFLANNSKPETITRSQTERPMYQCNSQNVFEEKYLLFLRNSAIFWAMSMSSLLIGNLQCFFMFQGEEYITSATRNTLGVILIIVSGLGTALMFGLRPPPSQSQDEVWINNSRPN